MSLASQWDPRISDDPVAMMARSGLPPDPWQAEFLRARPARSLLLIARQCGKSTCVATSALYEAVAYPGSLTLLVSPSQRQSAELLAKVRLQLSSLDVAAAKTLPEVEGESALQLRFRNGSRIVSLPGKETTVRGYSADLLVIDEAARVDDELVEAVRPMLAATGGRLVAMSTPWGRRGWFYESWQGPGDWYRVKVRAEECARIAPAFLAEERKTLPAAVYAAEYDCDFEDMAGAAFSAADVEAALDDEVTGL